MSRAPGVRSRALLARARALASLNVAVLVVFACAMVFLALLEDVLEGQAMRLDLLAYDAVVVGMRSDALTPVMQALSDLATPLSLVVMLVLVAAFAPGRRPGLFAAVNLAGAFLLNQLLKSLVQRPRPDGISLVDAGGYSFPSGHSMVAMAFFGLLVWMVWRRDRDRVERAWVCAFLSLVIAGIGFSRVYLGVHYASDVLAGFCVSLAWLVLYTRLAAPLLLGEEGARHAEGGHASGIGEVPGQGPLMVGGLRKELGRPMRRAGQRLDRPQVEHILERGSHGTLAVRGDAGYPYAVPLNYVWLDGCVYLHFALAGHKLDAVCADPRVSFSVVGADDVVPDEYTTYFRSAVVFGRAHVVTDAAERARSMRALGDKYNPGRDDLLDHEVAKSGSRCAMVRIDVDLLEGKEAIELARPRSRQGADGAGETGE